MNDRQEDLCAKLRDAVMDRGVCLALLAAHVEPDALQAAADEIEALCADVARLQQTIKAQSAPTSRVVWAAPK